MPSIRAAGSHGTFDIVGYSSGIIRFIQCKASKGTGALTFSPYKEEIKNIQKQLVPAQVSTKELWVFGDNKLLKIWVI